MSDLIERQAAIEALKTDASFVMFDDHGNYTADGLRILEVLTALPSAQPEIIRCKDCKNWDITWQNDWAKNYHYCPLIDGTRNGDWYCADAERREE